MVNEIQARIDTGKFVGKEGEFNKNIEILNVNFERMLREAQKFMMIGKRSPSKVDLAKSRDAITFLTGNFLETDREVKSFIIKYGRSRL